MAYPALKGKNILVGITGGIAVYKMCSVVRLLKKAGAHVRVLMTEAATQFVTPLTFSALSQEEVLVSLWPENKHTSTNRGVRHIDMGLWANVMLIAPATANTIAKLVHGAADDVVSSTALALRCPLIVAPSMDMDMYQHEATQANIGALRERGCFMINPEEGELASGLSGPGRLPEPEQLVDFIHEILTKSWQDLRGKKILITAGPTHEPIDPVRFIGNRSSGKMGYALASAAALRGAEVILVSGPTELTTPANVQRVDVQTAQEMYDAVMRYRKGGDAVIMSAAVADYTPAHPANQKIKKNSLRSGLELKLQPTPDILKELGERKKNEVLVGFALETHDELKNAQDKLRSKKADLIVLNSTRDAGAAFGTDTNVVTIISARSRPERLPKMSKFAVAMAILDRVADLI
jgi:phosphopantothenoylcysteine decarboxylase/phosphopantothenate--cysteine ligase